MHGELDEEGVVQLKAGARRQLWERAAEIEKRDGTQDRSGSELAEMGVAMLTRFPGQLVRAVHRFANRGNSDNALLIRGVAPEITLAEPTPSTVLPTQLGPAARAGRLALLGSASLLGAPFTFASLYEGRIVQHVTPVPGQEGAQTSGGSDSFLTWHVEDAWSEDRCDYFALMCLRGDASASTLFSPVRSALLDERWTKVLREPRFVVWPDLAHEASPRDSLRPVCVLSGPADDPEICFDALYMGPRDRDDTEAAEALVRLSAALEQSAKGQVLEPGDLLIVDNRRVVHARTSFRPRYDGADRWLHIPEPLRGWDKIWCPPMNSSHQPATSHPLSSRWIGMNLLMITPELAVVDADQTELIATLERHGVDVLPLRLRHSRVLGGGFHCVTLDTVRDGTTTDYFS